MAIRQAYKKKITIAYVNGSEYTEINPSKVNYIMIEHNFEAKVMPIIYVSVSLENNLYKKVIENKKTARIYLRIQRYDIYSSTAVYKDDVNDQFTYFLSSNTPSYTTKLVGDNADSEFRTLIIGLLDTRIMNTMRKTFSGIRKNTDLHTLIYSAIEDTKIIMKTPEFNKQYDTIIIPPMSSRKDMLKYIFDRDAFYSTDFLYFMDFDKSYLLDRTGEAVSSGDNSYDKIIIDIKAVTSEESYNDGVEIINNNYYLYVNSANTNIVLDTATEKVANQIVAVDEYDGTNIIDLDINTTANSTTKQIFERMELDDAIVHKNALEESQVILEIVKENMDASIITPNRSYNINNFEGYSDYNGRYLLLYKKEIMYGATDNFATITTFGMKKLSNIQKIGQDSTTTTASNSKTTNTTAQGTNYSNRSTQITASKRTVSTTSKKS